MTAKQRKEMDKNNEKRGALVCASLTEKLERYYTEHLATVIDLLQKREVSQETQQALLVDMWQRLTYTDTEIKATRAQIEELEKKLTRKDIIYNINTLLYWVDRDYRHLLRVLKLADQIQAIECKIDGEPVDLEISEASALSSARQAVGVVYETATLPAKNTIAQHVPEVAKLDLTESPEARHYFNFLVTSISLVNATDDELLSVEPYGLGEVSREVRAELLEEIRRQMREEEEQHARRQVIYDGDKQDRPDVLKADKPETETARTLRLFQNIVETCSSPFMLANEAKAKANANGEEVTRAKEKAQPTGVYSLKTAIAVAQDNIDLEASRAGTKPIKLSEERIYQCLNCLQVLANDYGIPRAGKNGVDYFEYSTSLRKIAAEAFGTDTPNAELIRQTYESLRILATNYVAIEEKRVKNVRIDAADGQRITKPVIKTYRHYVQLVIMPQITLRTNPDGSVNNDIGEATATIWVHSVLRTGRRTKEPVINDGKKEYIQQPQQQYITYESYAHSLRYFKSQDGSGRRFFAMLLAKGHKAEDDMLQEIFDYAGKVEKAIKDADKRARNRIDRKEREDLSGFLAQIITTGTTKEQAIKEEVTKETTAAEKKARRSISKNKARDRETLALWFSQAVELEIIEPNPTRTPAKGKGGGYVWTWTRKKPRTI